MLASKTLRSVQGGLGVLEVREVLVGRFCNVRRKSHGLRGCFLADQDLQHIRRGLVHHHFPPLLVGLEGQQDNGDSRHTLEQK